MSEPTRPAYWNIEGIALMYLAGLITFAVFGYGLYRAYRVWRAGVGPIAFDHPWLRLRRTVTMVFGHARLLRDKTAGTAHLAYFWGFLLLFVGTVVSALDADFGIPIMRGEFYLWFQSLVLDLIGLAAIAGLSVALVRRTVLKLPRLRRPPGRQHDGRDAAILVAFLAILVSGYVIEGIRIAATADPYGRWSPGGWAVASAFTALGTGLDTMKAIHATLWWGHLALASAFVALIPYTKMVHIVAAPLNIFFSPLDRPATLRPMDLETLETFGISQPGDLAAAQRLELEACTECGRCQDACPAYAVGQPLSPKAIVVDLRDSLRHNLVHPRVNLPAEAASTTATEPQLIAAVGADALWSCVTCMACVQECPVSIGHVPLIVDLRRYLTMMESAAPAEAQRAMTATERAGNPWGAAAETRADWAKELGIPTLAEKPDAEYLYFVGCAASFDRRNQRVAHALARILAKAGVSFAILGREETCNGDPARRLGNDYLWQQQAQQNIETFGRYGVKKVIASCPHCFNTIANEYPQLGGRYEVEHALPFVERLIAEKRITLRDATGPDAVVAYHDPCYLGRHNQVYDAPRAVLDALPGVERAEIAPHHRDRSFCCGAGGGHLWLKEASGGRINHKRVDQLTAAASEATAVASGCPFCLIMLDDGVGAKGIAETVKPVDVLELVAERMV